MKRGSVNDTIRHLRLIGPSLPALVFSLHDLQMLPTGGKAIIDWPDREKAYTDAATGIRCAVDILLAQKWKLRGDAWRRLSQYDLALNAYEEALQRDPQNPFIYNDKGNALFSLKRFEEAIIVYDKAIELNPDFGLAYHGKGRALEGFAPLAYEKYQRLAKQAYRKAHGLKNVKRVRGEKEGFGNDSR